MGLNVVGFVPKLMLRGVMPYRLVMGSAFHCLTVMLQVRYLGRHRGLLRRVKANSTGPAVLERPGHKVVSRPPPSPNGSIGFRAEESLQTLGVTLDTCSDRSRAITCFREGQEAEVDIVHG
jgi:hypothetical protein